VIVDPTVALAGFALQFECAVENASTWLFASDRDLSGIRCRSAEMHAPEAAGQISRRPS